MRILNHTSLECCPYRLCAQMVLNEIVYKDLRSLYFSKLGGFLEYGVAGLLAVT